jgi:hypothetical protein
MGLVLSILWGNTVADWVNMVQNVFPRIIVEEREWYALRKHNPVSRPLIEIQKTTPQWHPALTSTLEPILVVTIPGVTETFKTVIAEMTDASNLNIINLLRTENANVTHQDLNTSFDQPDDRWNIHLVRYDTLTSSAKP